MEAVTGLHYLHEGSDLDLVLDQGTIDDYKAFFQELLIWERNSGVSADVEIKIDSARYCKLKELAGRQGTVLVKGREIPELVCRNEVITAIRTRYQ